MGFPLLVSFLLLATLTNFGCGGPKPPPPYGTEHRLQLPGDRQQVWAVAPAINLSGQPQVDALLQADLLYQQLQEVNGLVIVPVNRVAEVYASLHLEQIQSEQQAALVCDLLGCDGLLIPSITAYDPYNPPKFGAALQLFQKPANYARPANVDVRELARRATPPDTQSLPVEGAFAQAVGVYDAANGSVRDALGAFAAGRHDPVGAYGMREYLVNMDRYAGFGYHMLIAELLKSPRLGR